jgi:O-antigen/teichoic acid export membrane protein
MYSYSKLINQGRTFFKENTNIKKYLFNTSWLFFERITRMVLGLFIGVWIARYLGPERFGLLSYAQSFVGIFGAIATLGLDSIVIRGLVKGNVQREVLLGTAFIMKLIGSFVCISFLFVAINVTPNDAYTKILVLIVGSSTIVQSFNVIDFYFQSRVMSKYVVYAHFLMIIVGTPVKLILLIYEAPLEYFAATNVLESALTSVGLIYFYKQQKMSFRQWKFSKPLAISLLKESWPLIFSTISIYIGLRIDQVMLKNMLNESSVGFYAVGVKLAEVFNFIPMLICQSIYPKVLEMDFEKDRQKIIYVIRYVFFILVGFAVAVNMTSYLAIYMLYGQEYLPSKIVIDILIWSVPVTYLNMINNQILLKFNKNVTILSRQVSLAAINICLNLIFIPRFGIMGAAMATLCADICVFFFELFSSRRRWIFYLKAQAVSFIPFK